MHPDYDEIRALHDLIVEFNIHIRIFEDKNLSGREDYPSVLFKIGEKSYDLYVEDKYTDFDEQNQIICLHLVLSELEDYNSHQDISVWSSAKSLNLSDPAVLSYYRDLDKLYREISVKLGVESSFIDQVHFELNTGPAQILRSIYQ
jgi:hypothetical protein